MLTDRLLSNSRVGFIVLSLIILVFFIGALSWLFLVTHWKPVMGGNVTQDTQNEISGYLMSWGVDYKADEKTGQVFVDERIVGDIRKKLEEVGVQVESASGFELFDEADYGMSEFVQKINYQRGLEGEISNTIRSFVDIRSARVHLTLPKKNLFNADSVKAKASVVVDQKKNVKLTNKQVLGIKTLVAAAVENLSSEDVVVLSQHGTLISSDGNEPQDNVSSLEKVYEEKIDSLISALIDSDLISISVNIVMNHDKIKSVRESVLPASTGSAGFVVRSSSQVRSVDEESAGKDKQGLETNELEYIYSIERSETEYASGTIDKVGVGVVIGEAVSDDIIEKLTAAIEAGIGIDSERGDRVSVIAHPGFNMAENTETGSTETLVLGQSPAPILIGESKVIEFARPSLISALILAALVVLLFFALVWVWLSRREKPLTKEERQILLEDIRSWVDSEGELVEKN